MKTDPPPLDPGWVLNGRFTIGRALGRGGFGIAYLAEDGHRHDQVVVKELAPLGVPRDEDGCLTLERSGAQGHLLRHRFLDEAELLRRLRHPGIPSLRSAFAENGTAYYVTAYAPGAVTLEQRLRKRGAMDQEEARELFVSVLDILESVHAAGILHRDIKPSNLLIGPQGEVTLIDFGAAREWISGGAITHTVIHTPGYAPPEQLSEKAPRGPATDLYALCATVYHALIGQPPPTASDRLAGIDLEPLTQRRPDLDSGFALAIEAGLQIRPADRPQSVEAIRTILREEEDLDDPPTTLADLDDTLLRLRRFRYDRRSCPSCQEILVEPRPLRRLACPVCRGGTIRARDLDERRCPSCRVGRLERLSNEGPLAICPVCAKGLLSTRRRSLLGASKIAECRGCGASFEIDGNEMRHGDATGSFFQWRSESGRGKAVHRCPECEAQYDEMPDGRWRQVLPPAKAEPMYPEEWTRVAHGLPPSCGNAVCDVCAADYWLEDDRLTVLDGGRDPFGYADRYLGQACPVEDVRWLGVGKSSGSAGLLCEACGTEFDRDHEYLRLAESPNRRLSRHLGEPRTMEDWHRLAQSLPTVDQARDFDQETDRVLREAYRTGEISFDDAGTAWRGAATRGDGAEGTLTIDPAEISFGGRFRRWRIPADALVSVSCDEGVLELTLSGYSEPVLFQVAPMELRVGLKSGERTLPLSAEDLIERLRR